MLFTKFVTSALRLSQNPWKWSTKGANWLTIYMRINSNTAQGQLRCAGTKRWNQLVDHRFLHVMVNYDDSLFQLISYCIQHQNMDRTIHIWMFTCVIKSRWTWTQFIFNNDGSLLLCNISGNENFCHCILWKEIIIVGLVYEHGKGLYRADFRFKVSHGLV